MTDIKALQENYRVQYESCQELYRSYSEMYQNHNSIQAWIQQSRPLLDQLIPQYDQCRQHAESYEQTQATIDNLLDEIKKNKELIEQKLDSLNFLEFKYQYGEVNEVNIRNKIAQAYHMLKKSVETAENLQKERQKLIEDIDRASQESLATEQDILPIRKQTLNDNNSTRLENKKLHEDISKLSVKRFANDLLFQSENIKRQAHAHLYNTLTKILKVEFLCKSSLHKALCLQSHLADPNPPSASIVESLASQLDSLIPLTAQYSELLSGTQQKANLLLEEHSHLLSSISNLQVQIEQISTLNAEVHILDDCLRTQNDMLTFDQTTLQKQVTRLTDQNTATSDQITQTKSSIEKQDEEIKKDKKDLEKTKEDADISTQDVKSKKDESRAKENACSMSQKDLEAKRSDREEGCRSIDHIMKDFYETHKLEIAGKVRQDFKAAVRAVQKESQRADYSVSLLASLEQQLAFVQKENADFTLNSDTPIANIDLIRAITNDGVTLDRVLQDSGRSEEDREPSAEGHEKYMYVIASGRGQRLCDLLFHPQNIEPNYPHIICLLLEQISKKERERFVDSLVEFVSLSSSNSRSESYKRSSRHIECGSFPPQDYPELKPQFVYERFARFVSSWVNFDAPMLCFRSVRDSKQTDKNTYKADTLVKKLYDALKSGVSYSPACNEALKRLEMVKADGTFQRVLRSKKIEKFPPNYQGIMPDTFPIEANINIVVECYAYYHMQLYKDISASDIVAFIDFRKSHDTGNRITEEMTRSCGKMGAYLAEFNKLVDQISFTVSKDTSLKNRVLDWIKIINKAYQLGDYFLCDALDTAFNKEGIRQKIQKYPDASAELGKLINGSFAAQANPVKGRKLWIPEFTRFNKNVSELVRTSIPEHGAIKLQEIRAVANEITDFLKGQDKSYEFQIDDAHIEALKRLRTP